MVECPLCSGTGKEICTNPDHGFIDALSFHDIGRIGCPCCGHDENHVIPNTICELCNGIGEIEESIFDEYRQRKEGEK